MEYQFVIQIIAEFEDEFDAIVLLEDELIQLLEGNAEIDGHDFGSGEANIFIITSQPESTFKIIQSKYRNRMEKEQWKIAYSELGKDDFNILYPISFGEFKIK
jgi:hypothetical protein